MFLDAGLFLIKFLKQLLLLPRLRMTSHPGCLQVWLIPYATLSTFSSSFQRLKPRGFLAIAEAKSGLARVTQLFSSSACARGCVGEWKRVAAVLHGLCVASALCSCTQKTPEYTPRIKSPEAEAFSVFWATNLNMT